MTAVATHVDELSDFREWARELRNDNIEQRASRPWIRLWDGDWKYRGQCASEIAGDFAWILNDTGAGTLTIPIDDNDERGTFLAFWAIDEESRGTRNIHITVDKNGARWGGRMKKATLKRDPKGDTIVLEFLHDYEELKNVHVAPNPFLPLSLIHWPKVFMLAGPARHCLKLALFLNLLRLQLTNWTLPADPLDPKGWAGFGFADWQIVVKPHALKDDVSMWTIISSRMKSWHDMASGVLDDAELMVECRRYITGDPPPWPGAPPLRNGTLVVDVVDKSGFRSGTSFGGNLATGLTRAIASVTSNYVEDTYDLMTGTPIPSEGYRIANLLGTIPASPYVVYRDGAVTGIQSSEFSRTTPGPGRITAGGRSMPGVDEIIKACVNYAGDVLGDNLNIAGYGIGSLGSTIDSFLHPLYSNSLLAWMSVPLFQRNAEAGWGHYLETVASGATQAYTLTAILDVRKRRRETDPETSHTLTIIDAGPWLIGDQGQGHWFLGDRIGATNKYLGARVFVSRARRVNLAWGADAAVSWQAKLGELRSSQDALTKGIGMIAQFMNDLQEIGFMG